MLRRSIAVPLAVVLLAYQMLDRALTPIIRPVIDAVAAWGLVRRLGAAIAALPPYGLLALLLAPFAIIEPLKAASVYWIAVGHPVEGSFAFAACHLLSIVTSERVFHIGRDKLLTIAWVARTHAFLVALRGRALAWLRATTAWKQAALLVRKVRRLVADTIRAQ